MKLSATLLLSAAMALALTLSACKPKSPVMTEKAAESAIDPAAAEPGVTPDTDVSETEPEDAPILPAFTPQLPDGKSRLSFVETTPAYEIDGTIDPKIAAFDPKIAAMLSRDIAQGASNFAAVAVSSKAEADASKARGEEYWWVGPYNYDSSFEAVAQTADMISISGATHVFEGGAHGNYFLTGMVMRRGQETPQAIVILSPIQRRCARS